MLVQLTMLSEQLEQMRNHLGTAVKVVHDEHFIGSVDASLRDIDPKKEAGRTEL